MPPDTSPQNPRPGRSLREIFEEVGAQHEHRMATDTKYRQTFMLMKAATEPAEPSRHYDRDGYCDNPARGY